MDNVRNFLKASYTTILASFGMVVALTLPGPAAADISPPDLGTFAITNTSWTAVNFGGYAPAPQNTYNWNSGVFTDTYTFAVTSAPFQFMRLDEGGTRGITNISWNVFDSGHNSVYSGFSAAGLLASNSQSALENPGSYSLVISGYAIPKDPTNLPAYWSSGSMYFGTLQLAPPLTTPVPEPETYAMMLAGLGLMGFVARRRKQKEAA